MFSQSLKSSILSCSLRDSILPHPGSTDELSCLLFGVMLAVIGTPVSSLSDEYGSGSMMGSGVDGCCSDFLYECFFFLTDSWGLVIVVVTADEVVRGEFGECFGVTLFFVFCVVLCIAVVCFRP